MQKPVSTKRGFTVLELLVVVAIIGIVSAAALVLLSDTRARSRDARRLQDIRELEKALNLYYAENGNFPVSVSTTTLTGSDSLSNTLVNGDFLAGGISDPVHPTYTYSYGTNSEGSDFTIGFCLETDTVQTFEVGCENTIKP